MCNLYPVSISKHETVEYLFALFAQNTAQILIKSTQRHREALVSCICLFLVRYEIGPRKRLFCNRRPFHLVLNVMMKVQNISQDKQNWVKSLGSLELVWFHRLSLC